MEELYKLIEDKIKASGYPEKIDGNEFYDEVSDQADSKENGSYVFMIKKSDDVYYEGQMDVMDKDFDLHFIDIHDGDKVYHVDFDA
ncbi:MAG: hypothetical protein K6A23_07305 [Butyrivibrio sp.]|nr:hypothetical protein [Butyrivibrio sp.]